MRPSYYPALDGLRGVAALAVMLMHMANYYVAPEGTVLFTGYLAVDFFFLLSGFVLQAAYSQKLAREGLSFGRFMAIRWVRLYPLVALSLLVAGVFHGARAMIDGLVEPGHSLASFLASFTLLPIGQLLYWAHPHDPMNGGFLFNGPLWSLSLEFVASALFGLGLYRLRRPWLALGAAAAGVALAVAAIADGSVADIGVRTTLYWPGFARLLAPFLIGMLVHGLHQRRPAPSLPAGLVLVALGAILFMPRPVTLGYELTAIFLLFPLIVLIGASARSGPRVASASLALGALSYPLYVLHQPIGRMVARPAKFLSSEPIFVFAVAVAASVAGAVIALKFYDEPVRAWASRRWLKGRGERALAPAEAAP